MYLQVLPNEYDVAVLMQATEDDYRVPGGATQAASSTNTAEDLPARVNMLKNHRLEESVWCAPEPYVCLCTRTSEYPMHMPLPLMKYNRKMNQYDG